MSDKDKFVLKTETDKKKYDLKLETDAKKKILQLQKEKRELAKEIKRIRSETKIAESVDKWKEISSVRNKIMDTIKTNSATKGFSLKRLMSMQEYYIYQNPNLHKLKTSNEHADWVKEWVSSGNKIETLIETANTTRPSAWRKMNPVRKKKKSTTAEKSKTNKQPTRKLGA